MKSDKFPRSKSIALLLDPDKTAKGPLSEILRIAAGCKADYIMVGGSLTFSSVDDLIVTVKKQCSIPVILFPGNLLQLSRKADIIMLLSLISGRNPELLIGNHVIAAPFLKDVRDRLVSVGYILISCGSRTSVEYISQTEAIPADKHDIVVATAMAGEMLGLSMIYLEAGSGALHPVPAELIREVRQNISIPLAVGGGIRDKKEVETIFLAGADLIILGNSCEEKPELLDEACRVRNKFKAT
jgi:putative glycerol-1-phosphate prenyltransferase